MLMRNKETGNIGDEETSHVDEEQRDSHVGDERRDQSC